MFCYEIRKTITRLFLLLFGILYMLYSITAYLNISSDFSYKQTYGSTAIASLYSTYIDDPDTVITEYNSLIEQLELLSDEQTDIDTMRTFSDRYRLLNKVLGDAKRKEQYLTETSNVIRQARYHMLAYDKEGISPDSYLYRYQKAVETRFVDAQTNTTVGFEHYAGWDVYFRDLGISSVVYLILIGYLILHFYGDKRAGNDSLIYPTKNGRWQYLTAKYFAHISVIFAGILVFEGSRLFCVYLHHGLSSPFNHIQVFTCFSMNPYDLTVIQYLFLYLGVKLLTALTLFGAGLLISLLLRQIPLFLFGYLGCIGITALLHLLTDGAYGTNGFFGIHEFLQRYRAVNLFGTVVSAHLFYAIFCSILITASFACLLLFYKNSTVSIKKPFALPMKLLPDADFIKSGGCHIRLWLHEAYKQFIPSGKWVTVLAAIVLICFVGVTSFRAQDTYTEQLYREYTAPVAGPYTAEKEAYLREQYDEIIHILSIEEEMREKHAQDLITSDEYRAYLRNFTKATTAQYIYNDLLQKTDFLREFQHNTGRQGSYLYETGYRLLHENAANAILMLLMIVVIGTAYLAEYRKKDNACPMISIIHTTKAGTFLMHSIKYRVLLLSHLFTYVLVTVGRILFIHGTFPIHDLHADICSLNGMEQIPFAMSIHLFYLLYLFYVVVELSAIAAILLLIAKKCRNELFTVNILLLLMLPIMLNEFAGIRILSVLDLSSVVSVSHFAMLLQGDIASVLTSAILFCAGMLILAFAWKQPRDDH